VKVFGVIVVTVACLLQACAVHSACSEQPTCSVEPSVGVPNDLVGSWTLVWWNDSARLPPNPITLVVGDGEIFGNSGCNAYQGTLADASDGVFRTSGLGTTLAICDEPTVQAETTYELLLQATTGWLIAGDSLILSSETNELLRFVST